MRRPVPPQIPSVADRATSETLRRLRDAIMQAMMYLEGQILALASAPELPGAWLSCPPWGAPATSASGVVGAATSGVAHVTYLGRAVAKPESLLTLGYLISAAGVGSYATGGANAFGVGLATSDKLPDAGATLTLRSIVYGDAGGSAGHKLFTLPTRGIEVGQHVYAVLHTRTTEATYPSVRLAAGGNGRYVGTVPAGVNALDAGAALAYTPSAVGTATAGLWTTWT